MRHKGVNKKKTTKVRYVKWIRNSLSRFINRIHEIYADAFGEECYSDRLMYSGQF
jgi:hypothetical protein